MAGQKKSITWIVGMLYIAASFGLAAASWRMQGSFSVLGISPFIGEGNVSDYLTVLSVHFTTVFLTTGLMSMLGAKEELVYHVDIVQRTLLQPWGRNFRDLSVYAFVTLAVAVAAFVCRSAYVVVISALAGTVVISCIFFKMIGIYFGKESWRRKIAKEIKGSEDGEYRADLQQLYGILGKNLLESDVEALSRNLALLIELKVYYGNGPDEWRGRAAKSMMDEIMERNGKQADISAPELYVRMLGMFTEEGKPGCMAALNSFFMDYAASHKDFAADRRKNAVLRTVFDFSEDNQGIREWIGNLRGQVQLLEEKDFRVPDGDWQESHFVELAKEVCQARLLASFHDMRIHYDNDGFGRSLFYAEIEDLVRCDEKRVGSAGFQYPAGIHVEENEGENIYTWEYTMEKAMRDGFFVRWFPRYAALYGGEKTSALLENFFDAYREHVRDGYGGMEYAFEYYSISPQNPAVYDRMRICYLQGCAEQVMKGIPGIADTVAGLVAHFWEEAQFYKEPSELPGFYRFSFGHIGNSLLYADDSLAGQNYNERPECMLRFLESLARRIRNSETLHIDMEDVFGGFVDTLRGLCPRYYSEGTVTKVEGLIRQG